MRRHLPSTLKALIMANDIWKPNLRSWQAAVALGLPAGPSVTHGQQRRLNRNGA